jgi:hypothetical protein
VAVLAVYGILDLPAKTRSYARWVARHAVMTWRYLRRTTIALVAIAFVWLSLRQLGRTEAGTAEQTVPAMFVVVVIAFITHAVRRQPESNRAPAT